jgi:hypothetical protein
MKYLTILNANLNYSNLWEYKVRAHALIEARKLVVGIVVAGKK